MTPIKGLLDPEARGRFGCGAGELGGARHVQPGNRNSRVDDEAPESVAERDTRSAVQRNHEALNAGCEVVHG